MEGNGGDIGDGARSARRRRGQVPRRRPKPARTLNGRALFFDESDYKLGGDLYRLGPDQASC